MTIYELMLHDAIDTILQDEQDFSSRCLVSVILGTYFNPNNFTNAADQLHDSMSDMADEMINTLGLKIVKPEDEIITSLLWLERVYRAARR